MVWGTTFVASKCLLNAGLTPEFICFLRFSIAYIGMVIIAEKRLWANTLRDELLFVVLGMTGGSIYLMAENTAINFTYTANVSLIVSLAPMLTIFLDRAVHRSQRISRQMIVGAAFALLGVWIVITEGHFVINVQPIGDFLSLSAAMLWAIYSIVMRHLSKTYHTRFITRKIFAYGIITILPICLARHSLDWQLLGNTNVILNLLFLSIIAGLLCYIGWNYAIRKIGAVRPTIYIYFSPLITIVASSLIIDEPLKITTIAGTVITIIGVYVSQRKMV